MDFDLGSWRADRVGQFDQWLGARFEHVWPANFTEPLRYPVFGGGKRVRPLLGIAAFEALGGSDLERAFPGAAGVELIHTYSLVHDDLPCMDDDDERRGRPTVHKKWDEGIAVLVGDALLTHAFTVVSEAPLAAEAVVASIRQLSIAAGYRGMVGGQVSDVGFGGPVDQLDTLTRTHRLKTGALITVACTLGGLAANADADALEALQTYGASVGLAFQLADDVLDAEEDAGEDGPPSYVKLLGIDETTRRAHQAAETAIEAVKGLPAPQALVELARYTVERTH